MADLYFPFPSPAQIAILMLMNEQPQPQNLPPTEHPEGSQPLYKAVDAPANSSFNGYDLTPTQQPVPSSLPPAPQPVVEQAELSWEASEYVHHRKSPLWILGYAAVMLSLLAAAFFLTKSLTFTAVVIVMAIAIGVFALRPPRVLHYKLTDQGLQIENSYFRYDAFRAFGIVDDGALFSVMLIPTKRFMPAVTMYFAEEDGEKIVDILGSRLPMQEIHVDVVDRLIRRLRF